MVSENFSSVSWFQRALWIANVLYYQIVGVISIALLWVMFQHMDINETFWWHISLSTAAYMPVMAVAIISFSEDNLWTQKIPRNRRYWIHGVMLMFSCAFVTAGVWIEYYAKGNRSHFQSNHAILGLTSWVLVAFSQFTGLLAANTSVVPKFIRPVYLKFLHNFLGIAGFLIGIGSLYLMLHHRSISSYLPTDGVTAIKWLTWIVTIWTVLPAFKSLFNQLKAIFS